MSILTVVDDETLADPECVALLATVRARPDDKLPALVLCDWLQDRGHPAAEELRAAIRACINDLSVVVSTYTEKRIYFGGGLTAITLYRGPVIDGRAEWYMLDDRRGLTRHFAGQSACGPGFVCNPPTTG